MCCVVLLLLLLCVCVPGEGRAHVDRDERVLAFPSSGEERGRAERRDEGNDETHNGKRNDKTRNGNKQQRGNGNNRKEKVKQYQGNRRSVTSSPTLRSALPSERRVEECRKVFREGLHRRSSSRTSARVFIEGLHGRSSRKVFIQNIATLARLARAGCAA